MIVSLDKKIRQKEWVNEIYKCNSNGEEQPTFEESTHLLVESKEHYEFLIEVNEAKETAKIVNSQKGTGEKYQIIYNPNRAEGEEETVEIRQGFLTTLRNCNYTKEQYKFVGWSENQDGEGEKFLENASYKPTKNVTLYAIWQPATIEEAKKAGTVLSTTENTTIIDKYGNQVIVPPGFKINSESANNVTGGVVIEDVSHTTTVGSEFVWIPVGTIYTNEAKTESKTINLDRYTFANDGTATAHGAEIITINYRNEYGEGFLDINVNFDELSESNLGNSVALNIEQFKTKTQSNQGYYIGRYEARTVENAERTETNKNNGAQVTLKKDCYIYNYVTQPEATRLSQAMYSNSNFISDLMNSYAWDTAIVFLQTFDNRPNKTKPYSRQNSLNNSFANKGTNNLAQTAKQDKICNIWDMSDNIYEWTTETSLGVDNDHCTYRGARYDNSPVYTALRFSNYVTSIPYVIHSFRPLLYLLND